ncbi:MAG: hypothetical protein H8K03_14595 [Nitrospira sp.]
MFDPTVIASALERAHGMITVATGLLNCSMQTIYNAVRSYPEVKDTFYDAHEPCLDRAELALLKAINNGQAWGICFYLKIQGRKRGSVEKVDVGAASSTLKELVLLAQKRRAKREQKQPEGKCVRPSMPV